MNTAGRFSSSRQLPRVFTLEPLLIDQLQKKPWSCVFCLRVFSRLFLGLVTWGLLSCLLWHLASSRYFTVLAFGSHLHSHVFLCRHVTWEALHGVKEWRCGRLSTWWNVLKYYEIMEGMSHAIFKWKTCICGSLALRNVLIKVIHFNIKVSPFLIKWCYWREGARIIFSNLPFFTFIQNDCHKNQKNSYDSSFPCVQPSPTVKREHSS